MYSLKLPRRIENISPLNLFTYWMAPDQNPGVWRHGGVRQVQQRTIRAAGFKVNTSDVNSIV